MSRKIILILCLVFALSACSNSGNNEDGQTKEKSKTEESANKSGEKKQSSKDDTPTALLEEMVQDGYFKSYSFKMDQTTDTLPLGNATQPANKVDVNVEVKFDGENLSEISKKTTKTEGEDPIVEYFDSYLIKKGNEYERTVGMGMGQEYMKDTTKATEDDVQKNFDFVAQGKGLKLDEKESTDQVAVYKNRLKDEEIISYFFDDQQQFTFKDIKGQLDATMKIDLKNKSLLEYTYEVDMVSTTLPTEDYLQEMYEMTDKKMDYEKYKKEFIEASTFKAENKIKGKYHDFKYNQEKPVELSDKIKKAPKAQQ